MKNGFPGWQIKDGWLTTRRGALVLVSEIVAIDWRELERSRPPLIEVTITLKNGLVIEETLEDIYHEARGWSETMAQALRAVSP